MFKVAITLLALVAAAHASCDYMAIVNTGISCTNAATSAPVLCDCVQTAIDAVNLLTGCTEAQDTNITAYIAMTKKSLEEEGFNCTIDYSSAVSAAVSAAAAVVAAVFML